MFDRKTVFIIGAGASWHYGYPTGEELVTRVIEKAKTAEEKFRQMREERFRSDVTPAFVTRHGVVDDPHESDLQWIRAFGECDNLASRLKSVDPLVIDYFLGHNKQLADIGRLCIAWTLLERETLHRAGGANENRRTTEQIFRHDAQYPDNWCRFIIHKLVRGCPDGEALAQEQRYIRDIQLRCVARNRAIVSIDLAPSIRGCRQGIR